MKKLFLIIFLFHSFSIFAQNLQLSDLGISDENKQDLKLESDLIVRGHKLYTHQVLGLITSGLMVASLASAEMVRSNNAHQILGMATAATYWTTFYFAQTAPKPIDKPTKGWNIKIHKASQWIHAPLMFITPIVGLIANSQIKNGEEANGLGSMKGTVGGLAAISYLIGTSVMFFEF
ncbi:MAG: hypothetical protein ACOYL6_02455 [Bacteriovoracaceae bacterium]